MGLGTAFQVGSRTVPSKAAVLQHHSASMRRKPQCKAVLATEGIIVHEYQDMVPGQLVKRYKRFLADIQFQQPHHHSQDGEAAAPEPVVVHCPNTGPMTGLLDRPMAPALCSMSSGAKRKYRHTLEAVQPAPGSAWVGVHSALANKMVAEALRLGVLQEQVGPVQAVRPEVAYGQGGKSRVDFMLTRPDGGLAYLEVKSVTLAEQYGSTTDKIALFPDTVSDRAQRHVQELTRMVQSGQEAICVFVIQRGDCSWFAPCWEKDPQYARLLGQAVEAGVKVVAMCCSLDMPADVVVDEEGAVQGGGPLSATVRYTGPAKVDLQYKQQSAQQEQQAKGKARGRKRKAVGS
mmetsp:Transcript_14437/g.31267  ORF Transcript_14437/g.31267 Transcript_14437/m.31267 type:complete len:347 (+) Transcript_14437:76-1116(+)